MQAGNIVDCGNTTEVLAAPKSDYTQLLLSSVPRPGWKPRRREAAPAVPADAVSG
jgi:ABC-type dipeptide/oligopeptide/nickel transport system ATPase component